MKDQGSALSPCVLVVEDEPSITENILYSLESEGMQGLHAATGADAMRLLAAGRVDLVVLDVGLPDVNGFDLCREIRRQWTLPVIFLTARSSEIDRVVGLEIGGDDYMVKPFSPRELTARVRAVLRRGGGQGQGQGAATEGPEATAEAAPQRRSRAGSGGSAPALEVDDERMRICCCGQALALSRYEFRLLRILATHPGRVFSRSQLMDQAWEEPDASLERTVDAHIKSLRAKIREVCGGSEPIRTHRGLGYSLDDSRGAAS